MHGPRPFELPERRELALTLGPTHPRGAFEGRRSGVQADRDRRIEFCHYSNASRNHQGDRQLIPVGTSTAAAGSGSVIPSAVLGGLHNAYRRAA